MDAHTEGITAGMPLSVHNWRIRAFDVGKIFTGEDGMGVTKHNRVNAGNSLR